MGKNKSFICWIAVAAISVLSSTLFESIPFAADWPSGQIKIVPVHMGENIQTALNQAKPGSVILVSPGTYYGPIQLKSGVTLRSEAGAQKTVIDGHGQGQAVVIGADNCTLEGFTITGQGQPEDPKSTGHAVECNNTSPVLKNNFIANNYGVGIWVKGRQAKPEIAGNRVYSNGSTGIANDDGSKAVIVKNECYNNGKSGIVMRYGASPQIEGNRLYNNKMAGIGIQKDCAPLIKDNYCYQNELSGIGVQGGKPTLEGNRLYNNNRCGVGAREGAVIVATGNTITGNTLAGIGAQGGSTVKLANNTINENVLAGVTLTDGCIGSLTNNKLEKNGAQGVVCSASRVDIRNNSIVGNIHQGVGIYRFSKATVTDNNFADNGYTDKRGSGILVVASDDVNIRNNVFDNNYGPGVYAHHCSPIIERNEFSNDLIFAKDKASPIIANNTFYNAGKSGGKRAKAGVDIRNDCNPLIRDNEFYGKFGISVRYNSRPYIIGNIFSGSHEDSVNSGRSGIKVDNSTPVIKENIFYNGNRLWVKGQYFRENVTLYFHLNKIKPVVGQSLKKDAQIPAEKLIVIANNLFLD